MGKFNARSVSKEIFAMARVRDNAPPGDLVIEEAMERVRRSSNRRNRGRERPSGETRRARREEAAFRDRRLIRIAGPGWPPPRGRRLSATGAQRAADSGARAPGSDESSRASRR